MRAQEQLGEHEAQAVAEAIVVEHLSCWRRQAHLMCEYQIYLLDPLKLS